MNPPAASGSGNNTLLKPSNSRQSKRLFAHNIPPNVTEDTLQQFFNLQLNGLNVISGVDPCQSVQISKDGKFALLEFNTAADATVALAFDGITMEEHEANRESNGESNGNVKGLTIVRPKDYIVPLPTDEEPRQEGVVSSNVPDSPNKICVSNIPPFIQEDQVTMLLVSFGELKSFVLVKDVGTDESRVCIYPVSTKSLIYILTEFTRELPSVSILIQHRPELQLKGSTAWSSEIGDLKLTVQVLAPYKLPDLIWVSMRCPCLRKPPHRTLKLDECSSC